MTDLKRKKPFKRKSFLTDANKPVLDALRKVFPDQKIWIGRGDTIEINRKPLANYVATPGDGVTAELHVKRLSEVIALQIEITGDAGKIISAVSDDVKKDDVKKKKRVIPAVPKSKREQLNEGVPSDPWDDFAEVNYSNLKDPIVWLNLTKFTYPPGFVENLVRLHGWKPEISDTVILEYERFMYLKSVYSDDDLIPSHVIDLVWRYHVIHTESYDNFCSILENSIAYVPVESVVNRDANLSEIRHKFAKTFRFYNTEFGTIPLNVVIWADPNKFEYMRKYMMVNRGWYWLIKRFWYKK